MTKRLLPYAVALAGFIGLTISLTWPIAGQLGTHIPGSEGDVWVHLWTFNWVKEALLNGRNLFYSNLTFYPNGTSLVAHNFAWLQILFWIPLQGLFGIGIAYSLIFLATLIFNGFAAFLLVDEIVESKIAAFTGGMVAGFWPYLLSHHSHPNLILTGFVSLALLYLHRTFRDGRRRDALLSGLFIGLMGVGRWQMLLLGGVLVGLYFVYELQEIGRANSRKMRRRMVLVIGTAVAVMLPFIYIQFLANDMGNSSSGVVTNAIGGGQSDLFAYFVPSRYHPWWGQAFFNSLYDNLGVNRVFVPFIGYSTLLLAILGIIRSWKHARFWAFAAAVYILLALGPELLVNGRSLIPLPYRIIEASPLGAIIRSPDRFNVILSIPMAVLAGIGVCVIQQNKRVSKPITMILVAAFAILIPLEYAVRYPTFPLNIFPVWYEELAADEREFGILELPMHNRVYDEQYMYYQFLHKKPIVGGHVSRPPEEAFRFIQSVPMLKHIPSDKNPPEDVINVGNQLHSLSQAGVEYIILHKPFMRDETVERWRTWFNLPPYHEDDELLVYKTEWNVGTDIPFTTTVSDEVGVISSSIEPASVTQHGWVNARVRWGTTRAVAEDYDVCFKLFSSTRTTEQVDCFPISTEWPSSQWSENELVGSNYAIRMSPYLEADTYTLEAEIPELMPHEQIMLATIQYSAFPRSFDADLDMAVYANWENKIELADFELSPTEDQNLLIDLTWIAQERMDQSYKLFAHLIDSQTQELVAQIDTLPRDWQYPTIWWENNEIITDTITIPIPELGDGRYQLWIGWYDIDTEERMIVDTSTLPVADQTTIRLVEMKTCRSKTLCVLSE
ncbi:MAG: hypothetical protein GWP61_14475 [Chloroflexi bacterium]|nr:hypothetical protein [Chloroflexota bacterium]